MAMAGEIEEPFNFNFQADSIHSGSISFGRFESESLSWERRSSFSHNRYLEEVEKCSKPGSVIEKKAYFEAHFKKKALLCPTSSEGQSEADDQTSNGDILDNINHIKDVEHTNEGDDFARFDASPDGSDYRGEFNMRDHEGEDMGNSSFEAHIEHAFSNVYVVVEDDLQHVNPLELETHQTETHCDKIRLDSGESKVEVKEIFVDEKTNVTQVLDTAELEIDVKENLIGEPVNIDEVPDATDLSSVSQTAGVSSSDHQRSPSPKSRVATETKLIKPRWKPQVSASHSQRNISTEAIKDSSSSRRERKIAQVTKTDERSSHIVDPNAHSIRRTSTPDNFRTLKAKSIHECKSVTELRANKVVEPQPSALEKDESRASRTSNRPKRTEKLGNLEMQSSPAIFNFKSDERAEKRKQFYMKLEEKIHAKEAEMNQVQARTQEKTEAEMKQFRKSLNFKATPMPSFYHGAVQPSSDKSKARSTSIKSTRLQSKSASLGSRADAGSSSNPQAENDELVSTDRSVNSADSLLASGATNCSVSGPSKVSVVSTASSTNKHRPLQAGSKDLARAKHTNLQKHQASEGNNKVIKGQRIEGKQKMDATRSSNQKLQKDIKHVGMGSGSAISNAVGVAS